MVLRPLSHVIGFDDAPFERAHRGDVPVFGAIYAGARLEGIVRGRVRRDGVNATRELVRLTDTSRFRAHLQAIMVQGIALAGFNVVDIHALHAATGLPVIVVARKAPDLAAIRSALLDRVPGGRRKWALIERAGSMRPVAGVFAQWAGIEEALVAATICALAINSVVPEPLRTAHIVAGAVATGESRHRV